MNNSIATLEEIMQLALMLSKETKSRIRETLESNLREYVSALVEDRDKMQRQRDSWRRECECLEKAFEYVKEVQHELHMKREIETH